MRSALLLLRLRRPQLWHNSPARRDGWRSNRMAGRSRRTAVGGRSALRRRAGRRRSEQHRRPPLAPLAPITASCAWCCTRAGARLASYTVRECAKLRGWPYSLTSTPSCRSIAAAATSTPRSREIACGWRVRAAQLDSWPPNSGQCPYERPTRRLGVYRCARFWPSPDGWRAPICRPPTRGREDGPSVRRVRHLAQDQLQDLRPLQRLRPRGAHRP